MEQIFIDGKSENQRLDKYLKRYMPNAKAGFLYRMLREKKIKVNGGKADGSYILKRGDSLCIYFSNETLNKFKGDSSDRKTVLSDDFDFASGIIYEDEDVLLFNKPAGLLSQSDAKGGFSACEYLIEYLRKYESLSDDYLRIYRPSAVNRLDRNTSGLLICAKTLAAAQELSEMLKGRSLKKQYLALVYGHIEKRQDVQAYLKKDAGSNTVEISAQPKAGFDAIHTVYEPIGYMPGATLLAVDLITGKTHQIRAHLNSLNHSVVGDKKYCSKKDNSTEIKLKRQFLHSYRLTFPVIKGRLGSLSGKSFAAPLPAELKNVLSGRLTMIETNKDYKDVWEKE